MPGKVFNETTIQIRRTFGKSSEREQIAERLSGYHVCTSTFVLMEYRRVLMLACARFHNFIQEEGNVRDAFVRYADLFSKGQLSALYLILGGIMEDGEMQRDKVLTRLWRYVNWGLDRRFRKGIDELMDNVRCELAWRKLPVVNGLYDLEVLRCSAEVRQCQIVEFTYANLDKLAALEHAMADRRLAKMRQAYDQVRQEPAGIRGDRCRILGDVIIALEVPEDCLLYTTNRRHFEPLCAALRRALF